MALGRITVFVPGTVALAGAVNGEINNILNNPIALISPTTGAINFNLQSHINLLPSAITASSGSAGNVLTITGGTAVWAVGNAATSNQNPPVGSRVMGLVGLITSQAGTFAADYYLMRTTTLGTNSFNVVATSSFGANIGTAGPAAGGRDVAGAFSSTEVHWYAITTGAGSTAPAGIVSTQRPPTGPVMPTNYSAWCYLGASPYTSASTTVVSDHHVRGSWSYFDTIQNTGVLSTVAQTEHTLVLSSFLPSNAESMKIRLGTAITAGGGAATDPAHIRVVSSQDFFFLTPANTASTAIVIYAQIELPNVGQQFIYQSASSSGATANAITIDFSGWKSPIGSE